MGAVSLYTGGLLFMASVAQLTLSAPVYEDEHALQTQELNGEVKGCYYNYEHYDEGDRILTNEPCLNCTCHNRMLMCYLRVCPFTKAIGQDCKVEKRPDQCCPVITCPQVPVALLTSSTTEVPPTTTALGRPDNYGCTLDDNKFYADGAQVPSDIKKPCELCYCIRNHTACVMQECTLNVEGCRPVYQDGICCPVRYDCDYDDVLTTPKPTVGLITTPGGPAECRVNDTIYFDGEMIDNMTANPCEHCYCMRGEVVCAVQECGTPLQDSDCRALPAESGQCCPSTYECANGTIPAQNTPAQPTSESLAHDEETKVDTTEEVPKETVTNVEETSEKENIAELSLPVTTVSTEIVTEKDDVPKPSDDETPSVSSDEVSSDHEEEAAEQSSSEEVEHAKPSETDVPQETTPSGQYTEISVENVEVNTAPPSINHETVQPSSPVDNHDQPAPIASDDDQSIPESDELRPTETSNLQESEKQPEAPTSSEAESALSEQTTVQTEEVEKEEAPRVPGEGSCLVEGITYATDSEVPKTDKCHKSCKCVNSIVVCEEIVCSPAPENVDGCRPVRLADSCCPSYYECETKPSDIPETQDQVISTRRPDDVPSESQDIVTEGHEAVDRIDTTTPVGSTSVSDGQKDPLVVVGIPPDNLVPGTDEDSLTPEEPEISSEAPTTPVPSEPSPQQVSSGENLSPESIHSEPAIHGGSVDHLEEQPVITSDEAGINLDDKVEEHPSGVDQEETQHASSSSEASPSSEDTTQHTQHESEGYDESKGPDVNDVSITTASPEEEHEHIETTQPPAQPIVEVGPTDVPAPSEHHESIELTTGAPAQEVENVETTPSAHEAEKEHEESSITTEAQQQQEISITTATHELEVESEPTTHTPLQQTAEDEAFHIQPSHESDSVAAGSEDAVHSVDHSIEIASESPQESDKLEESPKPATEESDSYANTTPPAILLAQEQEEPSSSEANAIPLDETLNAVEHEHNESTEQSPVEETPVSITTSSPPEEGTSVFQDVVHDTNDIEPAVSLDETSQASEVSNEILQGSPQEPKPEQEVNSSPDGAAETTEESPQGPIDSEKGPDATITPSTESSEYSEQVQEITLSSVSDEKPEPEHDQSPGEIVEQPTPIEGHSPESVDQVHQEPATLEPEISITTAASEVQQEEVSQTEKTPEVLPQATEAPVEVPPPSDNVETPAQEIAHVVEPSQPVVETVPEEPIQPVEMVPEEPVTPVEAAHQEPVTPVETVPEEPDHPVENVPEEPVQPVETVPEEPVQPVETVPEEPVQPVETVPEEPVQPTETVPDEPAQPVETVPEEPVQPETTQAISPPDTPVSQDIPQPETPQQSLEVQTLPDITTSQPQPAEVPVESRPEEPKPEETPEVSITTQKLVEEEPVTEVGPSRPQETLSAENQLSGSSEKPESVHEEVPVEETHPLSPSSSEQPIIDEKVETVKEDEPIVNQDVVQSPPEDVPASEIVHEEVAKPTETETAHVPETESSIPSVSTDAPNLIPGEDLSGGAIKPVETEISNVPVPSEEPVLPGVELPSSNVVSEETIKPVEEVVTPEQPQAQQESVTEVSDKAPSTTVAEHHAVTQEPETTPSSSAPIEEHSIASTSEQPLPSTTGAFINPGSSFFQQWTPKPFEHQSTSEAPHQTEDSHYPSGFEPEYEDDDGVSYGPGTCRYGGKVYLSAQQIPRDDPCDFCFCFRSDIICLQQSCPPPIKGCYQETIKGFCCPRYECHVSMATMLNLTTTTTTTTTTLPPLFFAHAYKGAATKAGCQVNGVAYNVGDRIASTSGPCLSCRCGANGQMRCDPTVCGPQETLLRQVMDAASVARRR